MEDTESELAILVVGQDSYWWTGLHLVELLSMEVLWRSLNNPS